MARPRPRRATSTPTQTPTTTNASGTVVDDANGNPLAGVSVKVMPWGPCGATPAPSAITPESDGCPTYQTLVAPTMPPVPSGYTASAWETNGDYRLATLNASTEMPCLIGWQYERAQKGLPGASVDEWLLENVRANVAYAQAVSGATLTPMTTENTGVADGTSCGASLVDQTLFSQTVYVTDPRTLWFGGQYLYFGYNGNTTTSAFGLAEFPIDPRSYTDPNHPTWP